MTGIYDAIESFLDGSGGDLGESLTDPLFVDKAAAEGDDTAVEDDDTE